jgi:hypothetical protein
MNESWSIPQNFIMVYYIPLTAMDAFSSFCFGNALQIYLVISLYMLVLY